LSIEWLESEIFETKKEETGLLRKFDGILVPGGFGKRGSEGIIRAINFVRKRNIPFLGICFGFQLAIVEFARNQCGIIDATSENSILKRTIQWSNSCQNRRM
jgi:CTP synthase